MLYTVDPSADEPIMLINKHIGFDEQEGPGIMGDLFQNELLQLDSLGKKRIQVWINSPGGTVTDGYAIYNAILKSNTPVDTNCVGMAASIAGVIFQAGRRRIMADYGILMYHNPFSPGEEQDSHAEKMLEAMRESIVTMVCTRSNMQRADVEDMMDRTTFIEAQDAKQMGLCDEVEASNHANTHYLRKEKAQNATGGQTLNMVSYFKQCNKILNQLYTTKNNNPTMPAMLKITAQLGLHEAATEQHIADAIKDIQNRAYAAETQLISTGRKADEEARASKKELDKLKADMDDLAAKLKAKQKEYDDCKSKLDAVTKDKAETEEQAKEEKAKNMVTHFAFQGRIKNDAAVINKWVNLAKADFEGTREIIEAIPLNKEAVKLPSGNNTAGESFTNAISLSARVMNNIKGRKALTP
jgi:ATP-dependent Clp protease protease subunit